MKKAYLMLIVILAVCFMSWQTAFAGGEDSVTDSIDESQIIVAEYTWDAEQYPFSLADFNAAIEGLSSYRQRKLKSRESKEEYLTELIGEKLKLLAAEEKGFDQDSEYVKQAEDYKHQLMVEKLSEIEIDQKISYTEDELKQHYEEHKHEPTYNEEPKSRATCISVSDKELAQTALDGIKAGKDIIEAATELSEAKKLIGPGSGTSEPGDTGFFTQDISANWKPFLDAVFAQEIGEIVDAVFEIEVQEEVYYLIFRKEDYKPARQKNFDEVRDRIVRKIERQKKQARINDWIEELGMKGKLRTFPDLMPEPPPNEKESADEHEKSSGTAESDKN